MMPFLASLAFVLNVAIVDSTELRREDLMAALRAGGYTVLLRHARTDTSFHEQRGYVSKERSAQRNLSDDGVRDAALMGAVFRKYGVTFSEILASPTFRTVETAQLAAGEPDTTMVLRLFPSTPAQTALIMTPPKPGTNRLLVTHHFVIETHVPGITPGDIRESEAAVVRPTAGGKIELVGRITLADWQSLASGGPRATSLEPTNGDAAVAPATVGPAEVTNGASAEIPDSHPGRLARAYVAAFNSGDPSQMRTFIESSMVADPARPTEQRVASYATLFEEHGPLSLVMVESSDEAQVVLRMHSKRGPFRLTVKASDGAPARAASVTFALTQGGHS